MPKFFTPLLGEQEGAITGEDVRHIARVLRMVPGDRLTACDGQGYDYQCEIQRVENDKIILNVIEKQPCPAEPSVVLTVYQCLPKQDKMSTIVQKCVELGAAEIVPVQSHRCVSRPDAKSLAGKCARWQKTAHEAAKQCGRGVLPLVGECLGFSQALARMQEADLAVMLYEKNGQSLTDLVAAAPGVRHIALLVGSEGGFEESEAQAAKEAGIALCHLGPRILRCETAPLAACAVLMNLTNNL